MFVQGGNFGPKIDCLDNKCRTLISSIRLFVSLVLDIMHVSVIFAVSDSVKGK